MTEIVHVLRRELQTIEGELATFEAEAAKIQARVRLTLDKAEKVRALIELYADEAATDTRSPMVSAATTPADSFRPADEASEPATLPQDAGGALYPPILRRFGRGSPPATER